MNDCFLKFKGTTQLSSDHQLSNSEIKTETPASNSDNTQEQNGVMEVTVSSDGVDQNATEQMVQGSALEQLANNLEATGKYRTMTDEVKENDMIAFKVLTPDFQQSGYIIALVEAITKQENAGTKQTDCNFTLLIMGKWPCN